MAGLIGNAVGGFVAPKKVAGDTANSPWSYTPPANLFSGTPVLQPAPPLSSIPPTSPPTVDLGVPQPSGPPPPSITRDPVTPLLMIVNVLKK